MKPKRFVIGDGYVIEEDPIHTRFRERLEKAKAAQRARDGGGKNPA